jgi:hypothetical protein
MSPRRGAPRLQDDSNRLREHVLRLIARQAGRKDLGALAARLHTGMAHDGAVLTATDCTLAFHVIDDVLTGYDPRRDLGIKPKPGKRPTVAARNRSVASYFLRLKQDHPEVGDKHHYATVTAATGFTEARVRKLVSENRQEAETIAQRTGAYQLLRRVYGFRYFPNSPPNSGKKT